MCGIVGFISPAKLGIRFDSTEYEKIHQNLSEAAKASAWSSCLTAIEALAAKFDELMSFALFREVTLDPAVRQIFQNFNHTLKTALGEVSKTIEFSGSTDELNLLREKIKDYQWQLEREILGLSKKVTKLLPSAPQRSEEARLFAAWSLERVLDSLDKLEVRGRDSAGLSIGLPLNAHWSAPADLVTELNHRQDLLETETGRIFMTKAEDGRPVMRFIHKVASLVGRLGDNGAVLRAALKADKILWSASDQLDGLSVLAHTRWASHGSITLANCHPVDGSLKGNGDGLSITAAINGDIDNYSQLTATSVTSCGFAICPEVTTDSKILPVILALNTEGDASFNQKMLSAMRACRGSLAACVQMAAHPDLLGLAQQGSGQALYVGQRLDGWMLASEVYGLAAVCRSCRSLNTGGEVGALLILSVKGGQLGLESCRLNGEDWEPVPEPIGIFSRDIYRGDYNYFIEKEIAEAPDSVRKTMSGKYIRQSGKVRFLAGGFGGGEQLRLRLKSDNQVPLRRVIVIGHGTASMSGLGISHLLRRALAKSEIRVEWFKASELFGFVAKERLDDAIVVAVSQSGTTTDTNRVVDIARRRGAWIHAIVNRRNSALVQKADSYLYTSDGRDIEMSVASTKAYYSQVAAGKLLSLFMASELNLLNDLEISAELGELETLPDKIAEVLADYDHISAIAAQYAPRAKNWALVGNGDNRVAAEEIRIKMSELCYKAIPCDVTEDKKHIDLSTEPLTLVVANDLPEEVVSDTVKEVAIFKAHNGKPIVLCDRAEKRFEPVAQALIRLPDIDGGLAFVVATVAGHLFGIAVAKAIDAGAQVIRRASSLILAGVENPAKWNLAKCRPSLKAVADLIEDGRTDSALAPSMSLKFMRLTSQLEIDDQPANRLELVETLAAMAQELSRPIDTIRHQAKTVTVGISRPDRELSPQVVETLRQLQLSEDDIKDADHDTLETISPLIDNVLGATLYTVSTGEDFENAWNLQAQASLGILKDQKSRYINAAPARGTKKTALRRASLQFSNGKNAAQSLVEMPLWRKGANQPTDVLIMEFKMLEEAPIPQMIDILKGVRDKYEEMQERIDEIGAKATVPDLLSRATPTDMLFLDTPSFIEKYLDK